MATTEFGQAMRRWRNRVSPETVDLPRGRRRRVPGLRREELAQLAGLSVDYITRLEQGRANAPSEQVIEALARALRLSDAERVHLFRLGALHPLGRDSIPVRLTPSVQHVLAG
jgi:transcriptional regulator with XRE-family HTH domain